MPFYQSLTSGALAAVLLTGALAGCASGPARDGGSPSDGPAGAASAEPSPAVSESAVSEATESEAAESESAESEAPGAEKSGSASAEEEFRFEDTPGATKVLTGHGISLEVPDNWKLYEQKLSVKGDTYESAVGHESGDPREPFIQFSMAAETGGPKAAEVAKGTRELASIDKTITVAGTEERKVAGLASPAQVLRLQRQVKHQGDTIQLDHLQLFFDLPDGRTSSVRFITSRGQWQQDFAGIYESFAVASPIG